MHVSGGVITDRAPTVSKPELSEGIYVDRAKHTSAVAYLSERLVCLTCNRLDFGELTKAGEHSQGVSPTTEVYQSRLEVLQVVLPAACTTRRCKLSAHVEMRNR